jgi:hypothetical protein
MIGILFNLKAFWFGFHYSEYNKRLCINLIPFITIWFVFKEGKIPSSKYNFILKTKKEKEDITLNNKTKIIKFLYLDENNCAKNGELSIYYYIDIFNDIHIKEYAIYPKESKKFIDLKDIISFDLNVSHKNIYINERIK